MSMYRYLNDSYFLSQFPVEVRDQGLLEEILFSDVLVWQDIFYTPSPDMFELMLNRDAAQVCIEKGWIEASDYNFDAVNAQLSVMFEALDEKNRQWVIENKREYIESLMEMDQETARKSLASVFRSQSNFYKVNKWLEFCLKRSDDESNIE